MSKAVGGKFASGIALILLGGIVMMIGWSYAAFIGRGWPTLIALWPSGLLIFAGFMKIRAAQEPQQ